MTATPPPLDATTADQQATLRRAAEVHRPLVRAARIGHQNGLGYVVFGVLSLLVSGLGLDVVGIAIGILLLAVGWNERTQAARLLRGEPGAAARLMQGELVLLAAIVVYAVLGLTVLPSGADELKRQLGNTRGLGLDVDKLSASLQRLWCISVLAISLLYQGGLARYFWSRRAAAAAYRQQFPTWARELVESAAG